MKNKKRAINTILLFAMTLMMIIFVIPMNSVKAAGTVNVSISSVSGESGDEVTVSVTISASSRAGGGQIYLSYDPEYIELVMNDNITGAAGTIVIVEINDFTTVTETFNVKLLKVGTSTIGFVNGMVVDADNEDPMQVSGGSGTVTSTAPVTYSTDNNLSSLSISPGVLSPAFSPNVTSYTTSVAADCTQLVVSAVANDSNATVSVSGTRMDVGSNTTTIRVTAQDGSTKDYIIYTTRAQAETEATTEAESETDPPEQTVQVDGKAYRILTDFEAHPLPSGYEAVDYEYNGATLKAGRGTNTKLLLMYLENTDEKGTSGFYIYDSVAKTFSLYTEVAQPDITYVILAITDAMEKPAGLTLMDYNLNGITAKVMMSGDRSYCVFYGVNSLGQTGWFRYDCNDKTIQTYVSNGAAEPVVAEPEEETAFFTGTMWQWIAFGASLAAVVFLIVIMVLASRLSKQKRAFASAVNGMTYDDSEDDLNQIYYEDEDENIEDVEDVEVDENAENVDSAEDVEMLEVDENVEVSEHAEHERAEDDEKIDAPDSAVVRKTSTSIQDADDSQYTMEISEEIELVAADAMEENEEIQLEELEFLDIEEVADKQK